MTQTSYEIKVLAGIHQRFGNKVLAELLFENMKTVGKPNYTAEEEAFAKALQKHGGFPEKGLAYDIVLETPETAPLRGGSSDVGDVTLVAPTATLRFPTRIPGCHSHHWSTVASAIGSFAHKGITAGAKVAAFTAYDLLTNASTLEKAKEEFEALSQERRYKAFIPEDAKPPLGWNRALMEKFRPEMEKYYLDP
jgi:aminobenzoyl-glutamate utilization protein B